VLRLIRVERSAAKTQPRQILNHWPDSSDLHFWSTFADGFKKAQGVSKRLLITIKPEISVSEVCRHFLLQVAKLILKMRYRKTEILVTDDLANLEVKLSLQLSKIIFGEEMV
jgi:hypothetical protein